MTTMTPVGWGWRGRGEVIGIYCIYLSSSEIKPLASYGMPI